MAGTEFIIALTQHRYLGSIFQPYIIKEQEKFFSVENLVNPRDFNDDEYNFNQTEKELVKIIEKYSDKRLMKKFSREENINEFFANLEPASFEKYIVPFIGQCMNDIVS